MFVREKGGKENLKSEQKEPPCEEKREEREPNWEKK